MKPKASDKATDNGCKARTRQQEYGSSWASTTWSCSRRATTTYKGTPMCKQHKAMYERDRGPE